LVEVTSCVVDLVVTFSVVAPVVVVAVVLGFLVDGTMAELVEVVGAAVVEASTVTSMLDFLTAPDPRLPRKTYCSTSHLHVPVSSTEAELIRIPHSRSS
jgi:hypothetical protein